MVLAGHRQAEGGHVLERLAKQAVKFLVAGLDLDDVFEPVRQRIGMARFVAVGNAMGRRIEMLVAVCQCIEQTAMPGLTRFERDLEAEPAIGVYRFRR
jgi:hypothetical protein